jgi:hypothetical protein
MEQGKNPSAKGSKSRQGCFKRVGIKDACVVHSYGSYWQVSGIGFTESPSSDCLSAAAITRFLSVRPIKTGIQGFCSAAFPVRQKKTGRHITLCKTATVFDNCDEVLATRTGLGPN